MKYIENTSGFKLSCLILLASHWRNWKSFPSYHLFNLIQTHVCQILEGLSKFFHGELGLRICLQLGELS